jgi:hypothetical protein
MRAPPESFNPIMPFFIAICMILRFFGMDFAQGSAETVKSWKIHRLGDLRLFPSQ